MIRDTALRRARLARGLTTDDVAARTRLSPRVVTLLDEGRFDELPGGLYARSYVRAFASATGIDPDAAVARVERLLPDVPDPVNAIRESIGCPLDTPPIAADLERIWSTIRSRARAGLLRSHATPLRVVAARSAGACIDTLLLAALNGFLLRAVAGFCGVSLSALIEAAAAAAAIFCAVTWMSYYVLLAGIGTQTAGTWICGGSLAPEPRPLGLAAILRKAGRAWFDQASIIVDVVLCADPAPVKSLLSRLDVTRRRAA
ncbi:MAG: helix-turn-helix domain-containing protein [Vicinamibacterales bacterium]